MDQERDFVVESSSRKTGRGFWPAGSRPVSPRDWCPMPASGSQPEAASISDTKGLASEGISPEGQEATGTVSTPVLGSTCLQSKAISTVAGRKGEEVAIQTEEEEPPIQGSGGASFSSFPGEIKATLAHSVPHKVLRAEEINQPGRVDDYQVKVLVRDLDRLRYKKVNGKGDQEPAIVVVCKAVESTWEGELIQEFSPKYEHHSNGEVERAVQTSHGLARTLHFSI